MYIFPENSCALISQRTNWTALVFPTGSKLQCWLVLAQQQFCESNQMFFAVTVIKIFWGKDPWANF